MLDTRQNRDEERGIILGEWQLDDLKAWLLSVNASNPLGFKFLVTPVGMSRNNQAPNGNWNCGCPKCVPAKEAQGAYCPDERNRIFEFIKENNIKGVVVLSGDTHTPAVFELAQGEMSTEGILEFSASPLHGTSDVFFGGGPDPILYENMYFSVA